MPDVFDIFFFISDILECSFLLLRYGLNYILIPIIYFKYKWFFRCNELLYNKKEKKKHLYFSNANFPETLAKSNLLCISLVNGCLVHSTFLLCSLRVSLPEKQVLFCLFQQNWSNLSNGIHITLEYEQVHGPLMLWILLGCVFAY